MTESQFHRHNRESGLRNLFLLTAPCPECHGTGEYVHGDDCSYAKDEGPCDCAEEPIDCCDVCGGAKRLPVRDQRVTLFTYHP